MIEYSRLPNDSSFDLSQSLIPSILQTTNESLQDTKNIEEMQYLNLIQDIITNGNKYVLHINICISYYI